MSLSINHIKKEFDATIKSSVFNSDLDSLRIKYLGKNGIITSKVKDLALLPIRERKKYGKIINAFKKHVERELLQLKIKISRISLQKKL